MTEAGLSPEFTARVLAFWERMEMKEQIDISKVPIEVQIVSNSDGASHFVGKFFPGYFRDEPEESITQVEDRIRSKITKDWEKKITLPEIKKSFYSKYLQAKEIVGEYPEKFLS